MPNAAEVLALVLELLHLDHFREARDALDEGIFNGPAHAAGERHELRRGETLVAQEDDLVIEKRPADFLRRNIFRKVDAEDLCAERAGDAPDLHLERSWVTAAVDQ